MRPLTRRAGPLDAVAAFVARDVRVALSYRIPFLLNVAAIAFTVVTYLFVARLVAPGRVSGGYFAFATLGLATSSFLAAISALSSNLREEQVQGTLEALLSSGVSTASLSAGLAAYPLIEAAVNAIIYLVVAFAAGFAPDGGNWVLAALALGIGAASFAGLGLFAAALVLVLRRAAAAAGWLVAVMSLSGGEFFPPELLPGWLQTLARASPFTHTVEVVRAALLEGASTAERLNQLFLLSAMAFAYIGLGAAALAGALARARRTGSLAQY